MNGLPSTRSLEAQEGSLAGHSREDAWPWSLF